MPTSGEDEQCMETFEKRYKKSTRTSVWIGYTKPNFAQIWKVFGGLKLERTNWDSSQTNIATASDERLCAALHYDTLLWRKVECTSRLPFMCQSCKLRYEHLIKDTIITHFRPSEVNSGRGTKIPIWEYFPCADWHALGGGFVLLIDCMPKGRTAKCHASTS